MIMGQHFSIRFRRQMHPDQHWCSLIQGTFDYLQAHYTGGSRRVGQVKTRTWFFAHEYRQSREKQRKQFFYLENRQHFFFKKKKNGQHSRFCFCSCSNLQKKNLIISVSWSLTCIDIYSHMFLTSSLWELLLPLLTLLKFLPCTK